jgi:hypothetical protein
VSLVDRALADTVSGLRLYIQSVSVSNKFDAGEVNGVLTAGTLSRPLLVLADDLGTAAQGPLLVKSNVTLLQNYRAFFNVPQSPSGGTIKLQGPPAFLSAAAVETYALPALEVGALVPVPGNAGGKLVVQLMRPIDVILFERRNTAAATERLLPSLAEKGYVPRRNLNAATSPGEYNVIYSGDEVPNSALREVVTIAAANGLHLRSIQPQRHLTNGIQNQIQIGSSVTAACLPIIGEPTLASLTRAGDPEFGSIAGNLPPANCSQ